MAPYPASAEMSSQVGAARELGTLLGFGAGVGTGRFLLDHDYSFYLAATGRFPGVAALNHDNGSGLVGKLFTHAAETMQYGSDGQRRGSTLVGRPGMARERQTRLFECWLSVSSDAPWRRLS